MKTGCIYRIYHKTTLKSYIGQTTDPQKRIPKHFVKSTGCRVLRNAIQKHGKEAFVVEILESNVPQELLSKMEILYIRFFNSKAPNGYNLTDGGEGMLNPSDQTRAKLSSTMKNKTPWNKGKTGIYSDETRLRMSLGQTGKTLSNETRRKIGHATSGQNNHNYGKAFSIETRKRMAESKKSPEYADAHDFYLSLPSCLTLKEKRQQLRQRFPEKDYKLLWAWSKKWETE